VGYERVQEFSRDYRRHFHLSPRQDRQAAAAT
jgi:transcriptional regulator GlxA family with amidase domain